MGRASGALLLRALPAIYGASLVFFIIRQLPLDEYGKYGIAFAFVNIVGVSWRGLWLFPFVTWAARGEKNAVLAPAFWLSYAVAILGCVLALILLPVLNAGGMLPLISVLILLVLVPRELACVIAQSESRVWLYFLFDTLYFIGSLVGFFILSLKSALTTAEAALWVNFVAAFCSAIAGLIAYPFILKPGFKGDWQGLIKFGRWIGLQSVSDIAMQQGDTLIAGLFFEPVKLAPYIASKTLFRMYTLFSQAVNLLVLPIAARLSATGRIEFLVERIRLAILLVWGTLLPINIVLWFSADRLFPMLLGEKYIAAIPFFKVLMIASFLEPVFSIYANALVGVGKPKETAITTGFVMAFGLIGFFAVLPTIGLSAMPWIQVCVYGILAIAMCNLAKRELHSDVNPFKTLFKLRKIAE